MNHETDPLLQYFRQQAEKLFAGASGSHDWEHTLRVYRLCERLGKTEKADMLVLKTAALLHDIGRCHQDRANGELCHAEKGAQMAAELIANADLSPEQKQNILHCIRSHRFRGGEEPRTMEAKLLFDADKLDSIGAVGVARAYLFAGEVGAMLHNPGHDVSNTKAYSREDTGFREFKVKLRHIKDRVMTREGRRLAQERHEFMTAFFNRFIEEYEGQR
ncbi:MAG: HD domain-containing protein [Thermodesulfobacteriota bacterium]